MQVTPSGGGGYCICKMHVHGTNTTVKHKLRLRTSSDDPRFWTVFLEWGRDTVLVQCPHPGVHTSILTKVGDGDNPIIRFYLFIYAVREAAAAGVLQVDKEDTQTNLADLFTKVLHAERRKELIGSILFNF